MTVRELRERIQNKLNEVFQYPKTEYAEGYVNACKAVLKMLDSLPSVDAVPVVRCRDCKRYQHEVGDDEYALGWCPFVTINLVSSNGFCSWGKRKED